MCQTWLDAQEKVMDHSILDMKQSSVLNAPKDGKNAGTGTSVRNRPVLPIATIAGAGMLTAVAVVLQMVDFPVPLLIPSFIKFDFSDLPALIGAFAYGPVVGILIEFLKNLIHFIMGSSTGWVGPLSNFLLGAVFVGFAGLSYWIAKQRSDGSQRMKNKTAAFLGAVVGALMMGILSFPINLYVTYPQFYILFHASEEKVLSMYQAILPSVKSIPQCLLIFNLPFTFVKGLACTCITVLIYKPLSPILHGQFKGQSGKKRS